MTKYSKAQHQYKPGDIHPETGRVAITAKEFAQSDRNGNDYAYHYMQEYEELGLDPWRLIDGIDPYVDGSLMDIWFANGNPITVPPDYIIFIKGNKNDHY